MFDPASRYYKTEQGTLMLRADDGRVVTPTQASPWDIRYSWLDGHKNSRSYA